MFGEFTLVNFSYYWVLITMVYSCLQCSVVVSGSSVFRHLLLLNWTAFFLYINTPALIKTMFLSLLKCINLCWAIVKMFNCSSSHVSMINHIFLELIAVNRIIWAKFSNEFKSSLFHTLILKVLQYEQKHYKIWFANALNK